MIDIAYLRQFRVGPYAIFDFALSYIGIYVLAPALTSACAKIHMNISRVDWLWLTLPLSLVFHLIFNQRTPFMMALMQSDNYFIEAIVIVIMLYMGLKNIRNPPSKS